MTRRFSPPAPTLKALLADPEHVLDAMRALGDPVRWQILRRIAAEPEVPLSDLWDSFPLTRSTLSYHLRVLREARLVAVTKLGRRRYVRLRPEAISMIATLVQDLVAHQGERLDLSA